MKKTLLVTLFAASLGSVALPATADIIVRVAPPAPRYEVVPAPRHGHTWAPGYWDYRGKRHVWVSGHWVRDRPGYHYQSAHWVEHNNGWKMEPSRWSKGDRDHDGIPNKVDRDRDGDGVRNSADRAPDNPRKY